MFEPELRGERMVRDGSDDAVFEGVAGLESEDAHRFHAHVLIRGSIHHCGIRAVGDGARQDVRGAAVRVGNVNHRDFDRFERAVEIEVELGKLADAKFAVDFHQRMNLFAAIAVGFKANSGLQQADLRGVRRFL